MVVGDGQKFPGALVVPSAEAMKNGASAEPPVPGNGLQTMHESCAHPEDVDRLMEPFAQWEKVKAMRILPTMFAIENGELTPTLKLKRKPIKEHCKGKSTSSTPNGAYPGWLRRSSTWTSSCSSCSTPLAGGDRIVGRVGMWWWTPLYLLLLWELWKKSDQHGTAPRAVFFLAYCITGTDVILTRITKPGVQRFRPSHSIELRDDVHLVTPPGQDQPYRGAF